MAKVTRGQKKKQQQQQQNKVKQNNRPKEKKIKIKTFSACSRRFLQLFSTTSNSFYTGNVAWVVYYVEN